MMEQDESFSPNCQKCRDAYGFIELMPENFMVMELFTVLSSSIVKRAKLQNMIWERYLDRIEEEGFNLVFRKLNEISNYIDECEREREAAQRVQAEANAKAGQSRNKRVRR